MKFDKRMLLLLALAQSIVATVGSLYFSEVMNFPPCVLCWYQRIAMYPLVAIIATGLYFKQKHVHYFVLPLSLIGLSIAVYHNLLYYKILPESTQPCVLGVSCTTKYIEWFGFVTIPLLSLIAFIVVTALMLLYAQKLRAEKK